MKKLTAVVLAALLAGCGGIDPNPAATFKPGDDDKSCKTLFYEVQANQVEIKRLDKEFYSKVNWNVAKGAFGIFTLGIPWLFMDFKGKEEKEAAALFDRNQSLRKIAFEKGCRKMPPLKKRE